MCDLVGDDRPNLPWPFRLEGSGLPEGMPPFFLEEDDGLRARYRWPRSIGKAYAPNALVYFPPEVNLDGRGVAVEVGYWGKRENGFWFAYGVGATVSPGDEPGRLFPGSRRVVNRYIFRRAQFGRGALVACWRSCQPENGPWQFSAKNWTESAEVVNGQVEPAGHLIRLSGVGVDKAEDVVGLLSPLLPDCFNKDSDWRVVF